MERTWKRPGTPHHNHRHTERDNRWLEPAAGARWGEVSEAGRGLDCSVGVMAYNEQANIAAALDSILRQEPAAGRVAELIVVASGCEDRTAAIVADVGRTDRRGGPLAEERRRGGGAPTQPRHLGGPRPAARRGGA